MRYSMSVCVCNRAGVRIEAGKRFFAFSRGTTRRRNTHMSSESGPYREIRMMIISSLSPSCLYPSSPIVALHVTKKGTE